MPSPHDLELLERRIESILVDLRRFRRDLQREQSDKGVLGSRGLTEFTIGLLQANTRAAWSVRDLLLAAEKAGYMIPTSRILSKRLTEVQYRRGGVKWRKDLGGWTWEQPVTIDKVAS